MTNPGTPNRLIALKLAATPESASGNQCIFLPASMKSSLFFCRKPTNTGIKAEASKYPMTITMSVTLIILLVYICVDLSLITDIYFPASQNIADGW